MNPDEIRILVVDDNPDIARGTMRVMAQAGYVTLSAMNGTEALQVMKTFLPHLVLSDRDMPGMDGLELCRRIKGDPALEGVFVVLISGTYTRSDEQSDGLDSGADGYIARPIANRELSARMAAYVRILRMDRVLRGKNAELEAALARVELLSGLIPICAWCKKIRDDEGYWSEVEHFVAKNSKATFTHSLCPECSKINFPEESEGELEIKQPSP